MAQGKVRLFFSKWWAIIIIAVASFATWQAQIWLTRRGWHYLRLWERAMLPVCLASACCAVAGFIVWWANKRFAAQLFVVALLPGIAYGIIWWKLTIAIPLFSLMTWSVTAVSLIAARAAVKTSRQRALAAE